MRQSVYALAGILLLAVASCAAKGLGCARSVQVRCVCALCWAGFFGKAGRHALKTLAVTLVVAGPVANMALNGQEVVRVLTCSAELALNLTAARADLMTKPFQNALLHGRRRLPEMERHFAGVAALVEPLVREVEPGPRAPSVLPAAEYQRAYTATLTDRCLAQLQTGVDRCRASFERTYGECHRSLPALVGPLLCWPLTADFACSSAKLFGAGTPCQAERVLDADFGQNYRLLKQTEQRLTGGVGSIALDFDLLPHRSDAARTVRRASERMATELGRKAGTVRVALSLVRKLLALLFLRVIYRAVRYQDAYLRRIDFHNRYVTAQFRRLDAGRATPLLPLRAVQRARLIDARAGICNRAELRHVLGSAGSLTFHCLATTLLVLVDALLYETLATVARHSAIDYHQSGFHRVNVTVTGTGALAALIRGTVEGFRTVETLDWRTSNARCLPRPVRLGSAPLAALYGLYVLLAALVVVEAYVQRGRRAICAFFYPARERMRTVFLYERVRREAASLRRSLEPRIAQLRRDRRKRRPVPLRERLALAGWVRPPDRCCVCRGEGAPHQCRRCDCYLRYCAGCWREAGRQCCVCRARPGPARPPTTGDGVRCCNPLNAA